MHCYSVRYCISTSGAAAWSWVPRQHAQRPDLLSKLGLRALKLRHGIESPWHLLFGCIFWRCQVERNKKVENDNMSTQTISGLIHLATPSGNHRLPAIFPNGPASQSHEPLRYWGYGTVNVNLGCRTTTNTTLACHDELGWTYCLRYLLSLNDEMIRCTVRL